MAMPHNLAAPLNYGKRLLPVLVDEIAATDPERTFVSTPRSSDLADGFIDISYCEFAKAVNRCAWWLRKELGEHTEQKTVLYLGPLDLRYLIIILETAKAGHIVFLSSHRNSLEAHLSLLQRSGCQTVRLPSRPPIIIKQILNARHMQTINTPGVDFFMNDFDSVEPFPFTLTWEEAKNKPFCILYTLGSMGIHKLVFVTYGTFACNDAHQPVPSLGGKPTLISFYKGKRLFLALPLFHAASLNFSLGLNVLSGFTCVLPPPEPLTADVANQIFTHGSCETALHPLEVNEDPADWQYLTISRFLGHTFRLGRDGLYELVIVRQKQCEPFQCVFATFPDMQEFAVGDLFEPHPRRPESWIFKARTDDIIAFTTAEKLNPITMESVIFANPKVRSAIIGGQAEFQASLLLEPKVHPKTAAEQEQFIKEMWPSIAQANRDCPAHGRIMKGFVMLTNPDKPMPRAGKDTVQR
ncbi:hypothetical protein EPUS_06457 [Endocarpon pusillum Z07020]|uniref:AMP-dependent synthetase/ligase domain-containing protein n=1 Tax=Endocarpon pusillum (strain Z07020 / HMAS-L-300199) TaxID=1263415 RepID=U1GHM8_ENDPU|nr:uncharacterized protein EPUS_06457 [Endocarpon pusillum Z07020]ERF77177.1 hypothetical protein EPUS_06457 [Endocarpon pusillum Z07020]